MYEEGNEKSVKPGFGGDNTDGLRRQWRKQNGRGAQMGTKPQPQWKKPKRMKKEQKNRMMASQSR